MPDGIVPKLPHDDILTYEEILRLVRIATGLGITKVRITGGEPLVRKGVCEFLSALTRIDDLTDVSLTTNGVMLEKYLTQIKAAGIQRLNISLNTLQREKYRQITGRDTFNQVWQTIHQARALGFSPLKINVVVLKGYNDDELADLARLSITDPFHIRFIEYMPIGTAKIDRRDILYAADIKRQLTGLGRLLPVERNPHDGPAKRFRFPDAAGEVGFISAMSHHFCDTCNRLRLSASGQLRACLMSDAHLDLRQLLRQGGTDQDLAQLFLTSVRLKPAGHRIADLRRPPVTSQMSSLGG